ncbi:MAG: adenylosuccinate synthetase, partial [Cyanobacteria bacterium J06555_12]
NANVFAQCTPIYETLPGWRTPTSHCRSIDDLPPAAYDYLKFLAQLMDVPIAIVSLGASRDQTIIVEDPIHGPKRALRYESGHNGNHALSPSASVETV